ncbi:MAG: hypothetical protein ACJ798_07480 [Phenylobacterium sp.]
MLVGICTAIAPLAAAAAFEFLPARLTRAGVAGCAAILLGIFLIGWRARIDLLSETANHAVSVIALFSFAFLACAPSLIRQRWLRWSATSLSFAAVLLVWLLAMTSLALGPDEVRRRIAMPGGDVCEVTPWGMAFTDSGYAVTIYREWPALGIRRELAGELVNQSEGDADASCDDVFAKLRRRV